MRELLIAAAVLGVAVLFYLLARPRRTLAGDMDVPMVVEKGRAKSEAAAAGPVTEADEEAAAPLVAYVEEISSGEFPSLAFDVDPLSAPIPDGHLMEAERFFAELAADRLSAFTWTTSRPATLALTAVPIPHVPEADPAVLESFTGAWTRADIERMVAEAKAGAQR